MQVPAIGQQETQGPVTTQGALAPVAPQRAQAPAQVARIDQVALQTWLRNNWRLPLIGAFLAYGGVKYFVWNHSPTLVIIGAVSLLHSQMFLHAIRPRPIQTRVNSVSEELFNWLRNPRNQAFLMGTTGLFLTFFENRTFHYAGYTLMALAIFQEMARQIRINL
jgi:hypothetical protein